MLSVVSQVPLIYVHCLAISDFDGGNLGSRSRYLHHLPQVLNLCLPSHSVLCLLRLERNLVDGHISILGIAEPHHQIHYVGCTCKRRICCLRTAGHRLICSSGDVDATGTVTIHNLFANLLQTGEQGVMSMCDTRRSTGLLLPILLSSHILDTKSFSFWANTVPRLVRAGRGERDNTVTTGSASIARTTVTISIHSSRLFDFVLVMCRVRERECALYQSQQ